MGTLLKFGYCIPTQFAYGHTRVFLVDMNGSLSAYERRLQLTENLFGAHHARSHRLNDFKKKFRFGDLCDLN